MMQKLVPKLNAKYDTETVFIIASVCVCFNLLIFTWLFLVQLLIHICLYVANLFSTILMIFLLAESTNFTVCITVPTTEEHSQ